MRSTLETFGNPEEMIARLLNKEPSVFNDDVRAVRYRITIERIEEPAEDLKARLQHLLTVPGHIDKNKHVRSAAKRLGIVLD
ncbi:TPA: hypothetical protein ACGW3M_001036 [Pseudomonas aeruginosa]|uniref:hypothetical protein n=1 Tax=Pseudomonas aeruginosa TaxID=287 RepID=UPI0027F477E7|nr:hypothetical protein [Pseudomonas aeruginosa]ELJ2276148.1 hypothetical protein [Pseudomonas aeruginosa]MBX6653778.1 hypothetical protein [Pseudomonas aeruginosa]